MPSTVIIGGGIIGFSTAYYLAKLARDGTDGPGPPQSIHLIESCPELFASASGKAGGFIAKDWFNPAMAPLGRLSFDLHRQLAEAHDGRTRWGYSESISYSLDRNGNMGTTDSDSNHSDGPASDLDSEPPFSPDPEPASDPEPSETSSRGGPSGGHTRYGGGGDSGAGDKSVADTAQTVQGEHVAAGDNDWVYGMSRVPVIEQRTADALAALAAAQQAEEAEVKTAAEVEAEAEAAAAVAEAELANVEEPYWLQVPSHALQAISDKTSTGQLNPHQLCEFLLEECIAMGVRLHHPARATKLLRAETSDPSSQTILRVDLLATTSTGREFHTGTLDLPCDSLVFAAGCWTPEVFRALFPKARHAPTIQGLAGYSVTARSKSWQPPSPYSSPPIEGTTAAPAPCHAVFTSDPSGFSPELYSRAGGDLWIGGVNATLPLPTRAMDAKPDSESVERIMAVARELCGDDLEVLQTGLCFRPVTPSGKPMVAKVAEAELGEGVVPRGGRMGGGGGVFVAAGHGPWGISMCLGTGLVVSEMILGRPTSADVSALARW